jgi:hypothetical protein
MTAVLDAVAGAVHGSNGLLAVALLAAVVVPLWGHDRRERRAGR